MRWILGLGLIGLAGIAAADTRTAYLVDAAGERIAIATVTISADQTYAIQMADAPFTDHFLSMRPFRCLEGPAKTWCHVPYPYPIRRDLSADLTDLEYDLMFVWKGATDYGIDMWNGVYYRLSQDDGTLQGTVHAVDMGLLAVPPSAGEMRPLGPKHLHESDPDSHWLPYLVIE